VVKLIKHVIKINMIEIKTKKRVGAKHCSDNFINKEALSNGNASPFKSFAFAMIIQDGLLQRKY